MQMLAAVQPLDVSMSLSQHELENLQKEALQGRKPPPLTPLADDALSDSAAGIPGIRPHAPCIRSSVSIPHHVTSMR